MTAARHLRAVPDGPVPPSVAVVREAVDQLAQTFILELLPALNAAAATYEDPAEAIREIKRRRQNVVHVVGFVYDVALKTIERRRPGR